MKYKLRKTLNNTRTSLTDLDSSLVGQEISDEQLRLVAGGAVNSGGTSTMDNDADGAGGTCTTCEDCD